MTRRLLMIAAALVPLVSQTRGHSSLLVPPSRNSIDKTLAPWSNGSWGDGTFGPDDFGCNCINATRSGQVVCNVGQSCFYFSNGCSIGCPSCDGGTPEAGGANPNTRDRCGSGAKATINAPELRTFNRDAVAGSPEDIYKHNPWRAPGTAPVLDACGMAGGYVHEEAGAAKYTATKFAQQGTKGSELPPAPSGTVWVAGSTVQTAFSIRANHGGGYSFRLCPAHEPLTESCFQQTVLRFVPGEQRLRWANGTELAIGGTYVDVGTHPPNSSWAMNPLPYSNAGSPAEFQPPCRERPPPPPPPPPSPTADHCPVQTSGAAKGFSRCNKTYCATGTEYAFTGNSVLLSDCAAQCEAVNCSCFDFNPSSSGVHPFEHCRVASNAAYSGVTPSASGYTAYRRPSAAPAPPSPSPPHGGGGQVEDGYCSGEFPFNVMILDSVQIPRVITPGEYVLGFRWDCEKSAQVWMACADVTVVA